ncbi:MAG: threonine synthase [Ardenticatenales bacterium]|nr:threonine synthase [Ardenticatenales bacterium]
MENVTHLHCLICGRDYAPDEVAYVCPEHGREGILDVRYDYARIARHISPLSLSRDQDFTIWRYRPLLPIAADAPAPPLAVGGTPLYQAQRLGARLGLPHLWVKDDGRNPTASFKDRASAIAVVKAQEAGAAIITTASTGNAAAALAGLCASVGRQNVIFVPKSAPAAKIAQLLVYGATVLLVDGSYDDAFDLCLAAADTYGWYNRNTAYNPYMSEGKKTVSYEIAEQMGWQAPDAVFVSVGDGCIIGGVHKGFRDLLALGWITHMPRIFGVQAAGSNYLAQAWERGEDVLTKPPIQAHTVADSISAGLPRDRLKAMAAVVETGGAFVTVSDEQILAAIPDLARGCGVFAEPAGAAAFAGLQQAVQQNRVAPEDRVVVINTGNGLKDVQSAMRGAALAGAEPHPVRPLLADVRRLFG